MQYYNGRLYNIGGSARVIYGTDPNRLTDDAHLYTFNIGTFYSRLRIPPRRIDNIIYNIGNTFYTLFPVVS